MKMRVLTIYVDDQEKALDFYTGVMGFSKKADFGNGAYRWLTVTTAEDPDGVELQLAANTDPAAKAYQDAMQSQGKPAVMFFTNDVKADHASIAAKGGDFKMGPTDVPGATIAQLNDTCGNLIQISQVAQWQ